MLCSPLCITFQRNLQISQLEIEIQGIPLSIRPQYTTRLKQAKQDLARYKKLSKDLHSQSSRTDLLGGNAARGFRNSPSDDPYGEQGDRTRLLAGHDSLTDGSRRLADSQRIALETEQQGADILRNLGRQREQIENTRDTVRNKSFHIISTDALSSCKKQILQLDAQLAP